MRGAVMYAPGDVRVEDRDDDGAGAGEGGDAGEGFVAGVGEDAAGEG